MNTRDVETLKEWKIGWASKIKSIVKSYVCIFCGNFVSFLYFQGSSTSSSSSSMSDEHVTELPVTIGG